jgi:hypothetical protein
MTTPEGRSRPDGSAWREAQRTVATNNDEARKRGRKERADMEKREALHRATEARRGIYR